MDPNKPCLTVADFFTPEQWEFIKRAIGIALGIWLIMIFLPWIWIWSDTAQTDPLVSRSTEVLQRFGTLGDMFGAVNVLVSSAGFLGALLAINLQSKQLREQQAEIKEARENKEAEDIKQKRLMLLRAHTALYTSFATRYAADPNKYDMEHDCLATAWKCSGGNDCRLQEDLHATVKYQMDKHEKQIKEILEDIESNSPFVGMIPF